MAEKYSEAWSKGAEISKGYTVENAHRYLIRAIEAWGAAWVDDALRLENIEKARISLAHLWEDVKVSLIDFKEAATRAGYEQGYDEGQEEVLTAEKGPV